MLLAFHLPSYLLPDITLRQGFIRQDVQYGQMIIMIIDDEIYGAIIGTNSAYSCVPMRVKICNKKTGKSRFYICTNFVLIAKFKKKRETVEAFICEGIRKSKGII